MKPVFRESNKDLCMGVGTKFESKGNSFTLVSVGFCHVAVMHSDFSICPVRIKKAQEWQVEDPKHLTWVEFEKVVSSYQTSYLCADDIKVVV